jgi:alcohol dehydrogenase class IV
MSYAVYGGILHPTGHQISAMKDSHHGLTNAVLTIPSARYNQPACIDRFAEMAELMGVDTSNMTRVQAADKWFEEVERLQKDLNIGSTRLSERFGLEQKDLEHIISVISKDITCTSNPREFNPQEWLEVLQAAL